MSSIQVNGFYRATSNVVLTFYVTTPFTRLEPGWTLTNVTGLKGTVSITDSSNQNGSGYLWSFNGLSDTKQLVQGTQQFLGATIFTPGKKPQVVGGGATSSGFLFTEAGTAVFYFTEGVPYGLHKGWTVKGIDLLPANATVRQNAGLPGTFQIRPRDKKRNYVAYANFKTDAAMPNSSEPKDYTGVVFSPPLELQAFGKEVYQIPIPDEPITVTFKDEGKGVAPMRELNEGLPPVTFQEETYKTVTHGFNPGTSFSLYAIGPQEALTRGTDPLITPIKQHSNFAMDQTIQLLNADGGAFLGNTVTVELTPALLGDLMSNMYLCCDLPVGPTYVENVGRALISKIDFMIDATVVETLYDDWYIIRDQLFLDADEQVGIQHAITGNTLCVPLEFFFCRRKSHGRNERLRKPYFPLCSCRKNKIYIRITFNTWIWISADAQNDIINPYLLIETIMLTQAERLYYMNTPSQVIINRVQKEAVLEFNNSNPRIAFTANFPVQMIAWFFRSKLYEKQLPAYFDTRYEYGYTTKYIQDTVKIAFPSGTTNYKDVLDSAKITLNNADILSSLQGSLFYSYVQPIEHSLSIPSKSIYMYSFALNPKEYNQGGYIDFSKLDSTTSNLLLNLTNQYAAQVIQGYNLYLFYYGYGVLNFANGSASLAYA